MKLSHTFMIPNEAERLRNSFFFLKQRQPSFEASKITVKGRMTFPASEHRPRELLARQHAKAQS